MKPPYEPASAAPTGAESAKQPHRAVSSPYSRVRLAQGIRRYRHTRDRPRQTRQAPLPYSYDEMDEIIRLAEIWLPFGEPPEEEIFTRFGFDRATFRRKLHAVLSTP